ncbi:MAG: aminotransferase class III-fold pyridoxal phosphate-dependent enzyme [Limnochordaceae bacterium]|nr:aminotransferase class III-fold pyridoxal phosphate-dependent enzyme [Limnochordaceae bacterium]
MTGSDAVELALKLAKLARGGGAIVGLWRAFHGATAAALAASGKPEAELLDPALRELLPGGFLHASPPYCYRCDFGATYPECAWRCLGDLEERLAQAGQLPLPAPLPHPEWPACPGRPGRPPAAVIAEPILTGGGVIVPPPGYLRALRALCDRTGALLILDEVVTGMGRTGTPWAWQQDGVAPDILVAGKGLTAGYVPGSAVLVREELADRIEAAGAALHPHTHAGYPLMLAAALKTLDIVERDRLALRAAALGEHFGRLLRELQARHPCIGDVRGRGLLWGIELIRPAPDGAPASNAAGAGSRTGRRHGRGRLPHHRRVPEPAYELAARLRRAARPGAHRGGRKPPALGERGAHPAPAPRRGETASGRRDGHPGRGARKPDGGTAYPHRELRRRRREPLLRLSPAARAEERARYAVEIPA